MAIFICGTDTDVGKTVVSAWLAMHLCAHYWKPIQTGTLDNNDTDWVRSLGIPTYKEAYCLEAPMAPEIAAKREGLVLSRQDFVLPSQRRVIIEGAGGICVPIFPGFMLRDLLVAWDLPTIVVARAAVGTINHSCLTVEALERYNVPVLGIIFSTPPVPEVAALIAHYTQVPILGHLPALKNMSRAALESVPLPPGLQLQLEKFL